MLACRPGGFYVDGTLGAGGHAEAILRAAAPDGRLLGCDRDAETLEVARRRLLPFGDRVVLRHAEFRRLPEILDAMGVETIDGLLLDLGLSSLQLDDPERGFSFQKEGPLDMRMDRSRETTAADLLNRLTLRELASLIARFGEEPAARRIATAIVEQRERRRIETTTQLAQIVASAGGARAARVHPATRVFQALRIAVNQEIDGLDHLLEQAVIRLRPGGRVAVLAFHSLEDRVVKRTFRGLARRCICPRDLPVCACGRPDLVRLVTPRPVRPKASEIAARLRAVERLGEAGPSGAIERPDAAGAAAGRSGIRDLRKAPRSSRRGGA